MVESLTVKPQSLSHWMAESAAIWRASLIWIWDEMKTRLIFAMNLHSFSLNENVHDETERNAG